MEQLHVDTKNCEHINVIFIERLYLQGQAQQ